MPTVLIVDDDDNQRLLYREELTMEGYDIIEASNGPDAIDLVAAQGVDCVVLDIAMPGMDGLQTLKALTGLAASLARPPLRAVAVTANVMTHQVDEYLGCGFTAVVAKPIRMEMLGQALWPCLGLSLIHI